MMWHLNRPSTHFALVYSWMSKGEAIAPLIPHHYVFLGCLFCGLIICACTVSKFAFN
jgi:hypothetical protein